MESESEAVRERDQGGVHQGDTEPARLTWGNQVTGKRNNHYRGPKARGKSSRLEEFKE